MNRYALWGENNLESINTPQMDRGVEDPVILIPAPLKESI